MFTQNDTNPRAFMRELATPTPAYLQQNGRQQQHRRKDPESHGVGATVNSQPSYNRLYYGFSNFAAFFHAIRTLENGYVGLQVDGF